MTAGFKIIYLLVHNVIEILCGMGGFILITFLKRIFYVYILSNSLFHQTVKLGLYFIELIFTFLNTKQTRN